MATNRVEDVIKLDEIQKPESPSVDLSSLDSAVFQIVTTFNMHIQNSCQYLAWQLKNEHDRNLMELMLGQGQKNLEQAIEASGHLESLGNRMDGVIEMQIV